MEFKEEWSINLEQKLTTNKGMKKIFSNPSYQTKETKQLGLQLLRGLCIKNEMQIYDMRAVLGHE